MTLEEYLKKVQERGQLLSQYGCDVAADPKKFRMTIPPNENDTDILMVNVGDKDIPKLLRIIETLTIELSEESFNELKRKLNE